MGEKKRSKEGRKGIEWWKDPWEEEKRSWEAESNERKGAGRKEKKDESDIFSLVLQGFVYEIKCLLIPVT